MQKGLSLLSDLLHVRLYKQKKSYFYLSLVRL